jgi:hypothetical protein
MHTPSKWTFWLSLALVVLAIVSELANIPFVGKYALWVAVVGYVVLLIACTFYITSAYWFTASTSFANPAVTVARSLSDTFAGIAPAGLFAFIIAQLVGMDCSRGGLCMAVAQSGSNYMTRAAPYWKCAHYAEEIAMSHRVQWRSEWNSQRSPADGQPENGINYRRRLAVRVRGCCGGWFACRR